MIPTILLLLSALISSPAAGQILAQYDYEDLEFRGIGIGLGRVWPANIEPTNTLILTLDLGLIGPRVHIVPNARFWGSTLQQHELDRLSDQIIAICERQLTLPCPSTLDLGEVKFSDLELAVDGRFLLLENRAFAPYVGTSLALHLLNGSGDFIDDTFIEDLLDSVAPGIGATVGFDFRIASSITLGSEGRFMLASDARYGSVSIGGTWKLPAPDGSRLNPFARDR